MKSFFKVMAVIVVAWGAGADAVPGRDLSGSKPNLIFILADDLGYGDLGCYGQKTLKTPQLDRMAAEGMRFTRFYAGSTVCAPSRCVLMTGRHTGHCLVRGNSSPAMPEGEVTVATLLREAGYHTRLAGKWGIGNPVPRDDPRVHGFDYFYGYENMFHAHNFFPEFLIRNGEDVELRNRSKEKWVALNPRGGPKEGAGVATTKIDYAPALLAEDVQEFLRSDGAKAKPFFFYDALNIPHTNNEAGRADEGGDGMEVPDHGEFSDRDWPSPEKGFARIMQMIDEDVGGILAALRETGLAENTIVFFSSDNGPHQEGGHEVDFFDSNGPLRGMKRDLSEGGVRVPMIAWAPGRIEAGAVTEHVSAFQDLLPTVAELAGADAPEGRDGISLVPTLCGMPDDQEKHEALYWEFLEKGGKQGVLLGSRWKGIRLEAQRKPGGPIALYDLEADLMEENDLAAENPELVEKIAGIIAAAHVPDAAATP